MIDQWTACKNLVPPLLIMQHASGGNLSDHTKLPLQPPTFYTCEVVTHSNV